MHVRGSVYDGRSPEDIPKATKATRYHLVFIDGGHSYENVLQDFWGIYPYLASRSIVVFHDAARLEINNAIQQVRSVVLKEFTFCKWHGEFYRNVAGTQLIYRGFEDGAAETLCRPRSRGVDSLMA